MGQLALPLTWDAPRPQAQSRPRYDERTYRIHHRPSHRWFDVKADSAAEAVRLGGADWLMEDCWVRQYTDRGGWGKVRR